MLLLSVQSRMSCKMEMCLNFNCFKGKSSEDVSHKRASMVSMRSSVNIEGSRGGTPDSKVTAETPRRVDHLKRQSVASTNSPAGRSRKGSEEKSSGGHFNSFGFGASNTPSSVNIPINFSSSDHSTSATSQIHPEIRKFLKKFKSEVLCACLWGSSCFG